MVKPPLDRAEATQFVSLLYRSLLGREPDREGLEQKVVALAGGRRTVVQLVTDFVESAEFVERSRLLKPRLTDFPCFPDDEVFVSPDVVDRLFEKTSRYWRTAATAPNEMYWSVLTSEEWNRELQLDDRRAFVATGQPYADDVLQWYEILSGRRAADATCIDFGCGVGRLAINFAPRVRRVHAVDFSESHLAELKRNAEVFGCADRVETWPIRRPADLERLPAVDLVYSLIALQHNTPPVIAAMMRGLLEHLVPGGYAFLHVTLARAAYPGFKVADYLASPESGTRMEIHILPRANINELARRCGCTIVTSRCIGGNDFAYSEEFVFHRPAVAAGAR